MTLKKLSEKATAGPWAISEDAVSPRLETAVYSESKRVVVFESEEWGDAEFIATLVNVYRAGGLVVHGDAPQGKCETTLTERFAYPDCRCGTYEGNLGPCKTFLPGADSKRCVYCDHIVECHQAVQSAKTRLIGIERQALANMKAAPTTHSFADAMTLIRAVERLDYILTAQSHKPEVGLSEQDRQQLSEAIICAITESALVQQTIKELVAIIDRLASQGEKE